MSTTGRDEPGPQIPAQQWLMRQSCKTQPVKPEKQRRGVTSPPCQTRGGFAGRFPPPPLHPHPSQPLIHSPSAGPSSGSKRSSLAKRSAETLTQFIPSLGRKPESGRRAFAPFACCSSEEGGEGVSPCPVSPQSLGGDYLGGTSSLGRDACVQPRGPRGPSHHPARAPKKQGLGFSPTFSALSGRKDPNSPWGRWRRALKKKPQTTKPQLNLTTREDTRGDKRGKKNNRGSESKWELSPINLLLGGEEEKPFHSWINPPPTLSFPFRATFKDFLLLLFLRSFPEHPPPPPASAFPPFRSQRVCS